MRGTTDQCTRRKEHRRAFALINYVNPTGVHDVLMQGWPTSIRDFNGGAVGNSL